jgi:hypothetical protein
MDRLTSRSQKPSRPAVAFGGNAALTSRKVTVAEHADAVCLSFIRKPRDVELLLAELDKLSAKNLGLVVKVETKKAFKNLPRLVLAAMRRYPVAVMIARGDLAVECGWDRLAELQEEILWVCDAARVPVMWATQVLEQEAKKGLPSRAEITDAAQSQRADCVMLNKGPHILTAFCGACKRSNSRERPKTVNFRDLKRPLVRHYPQVPVVRLLLTYLGENNGRQEETGCNCDEWVQRRAFVSRLERRQWWRCEWHGGHNVPRELGR